MGVVVILYQFLKENPCMNPSAREGGGCHVQFLKNVPCPCLNHIAWRLR